MPKKKLKVLILGGGPSSEHEVSLKTAAMVAKHLDKKKYEPILETVQKTGIWFPRQKADVVFIAMHGEFGEDGKVQKILEMAGLPYTGSGVLASTLGMDKQASLGIFRDKGLNVPAFEVFTKREKVKNNFGFPVVIKPADRGSSVGVAIAGSENEFKKGIADAFGYSDRVMVQKFIKGRELTCGVLDDGRGGMFPLPITEILPKKGVFYDYSSKYDEGGSKHVVGPGNLPSSIALLVGHSAMLAHSSLGCSGMSRTDFIYGEDGKLYILEINTIPGMTPTSLLPEAAISSGISFPELLDRIIKSALVRQA